MGEEDKKKRFLFVCRLLCFFLEMKKKRFFINIVSQTFPNVGKKKPPL